LEAIVYVAEEPLTLEQIVTGLGLPRDVVKADLQALIDESQKPERGMEIRLVANGYKMSTKAEHHETVRNFVGTLRPKLRLSLPALETVAVIAYKQPVTIPEIQAIRGVNVTGVIHTLLSRKLITTAGRKKVIGKPMLYRTTKDFLVQFGLSDLSELPSLKELEEISKGLLGEGEISGDDDEQHEATSEPAAVEDTAEVSLEEERSPP
jgi:segregation and condensation protein B